MIFFFMRGEYGEEPGQQQGNDCILIQDNGIEFQLYAGNSARDDIPDVKTGARESLRQHYGR
jgi:hypothetical protein